MKLAGNNKSGITTGFIINRAEHTTFRQTGFGNQEYVDAINYYYTYKVNGNIYYGHQSLGYSLIIAEELNKARTSGLPYPVTVKYEKINPKQSILWFK